MAEGARCHVIGSPIKPREAQVTRKDIDATTGKKEALGQLAYQGSGPKTKKNERRKRRNEGNRRNERRWSSLRGVAVRAFHHSKQRL